MVENCSHGQNGTQMYILAILVVVFADVAQVRCEGLDGQGTRDLPALPLNDHTCQKHTYHEVWRQILLRGRTVCRRCGHPEATDGKSCSHKRKKKKLSADVVWGLTSLHRSFKTPHSGLIDSGLHPYRRGITGSCCLLEMDYHGLQGLIDSPWCECLTMVTTG